MLLNNGILEDCSGYAHSQEPIVQEHLRESNKPDPVKKDAGPSRDNGRGCEVR